MKTVNLPPHPQKHRIRQASIAIVTIRLMDRVFPLLNLPLFLIISSVNTTCGEAQMQRQLNKLSATLNVQWS
jgi:hypothetical protein